MYKKALEILQIFSSNGFLAYIVGGYPRDTLLGIATNDIDICTNAKPKDIMRLFSQFKTTDTGYGSISVTYKNDIFDITTFRKDIKYEDNRRPVKIKYINDLKKDLLRRDFTVNTICIDYTGEYLDPLNSKVDLENKIIKTVGNPKYRIKEDSLRILRAIRFATYLDFEIDKKTKEYIVKYSYLLKKLSVSRKKEELNKIFSSKNKETGRMLILKLKLDKQLGLKNLKDIVMCDDIIGVWAQLDLEEEYPFTKLEKESISKIKEMLTLEIDKYTIYKYGLYKSTVVGSIKGMKLEDINKIHSELPIYSRKDINITAIEIAKYLNKLPGNYLKEIFNNIERLIVDGKIENKQEKILKYIGDNYGNIQ